MCIGFSFSLTRRTRILIRPQTQDFHRQHECVTLAGVCTRIGHEPRTQKKRTNKKKTHRHTHTHTEAQKKTAGTSAKENEPIRSEDREQTLLARSKNR